MNHYYVEISLLLIILEEDNVIVCICIHLGNIVLDLNAIQFSLL